MHVCVCLCILRGLEKRANGGLRSSASPSSCTPGTRVATCLRGFQYPVYVCLCACEAVFTQGMQFIIFVCVSGYYIYSLHTCVKKQMENEGGGNTLSTPFKNPQQAPAVRVLIACLFSWLSAITSAKDSAYIFTLFSLNVRSSTYIKSCRYAWRKEKKKAEIFISKVLAGAAEAPVSMGPYLAESRLLARPDKSCQRLEESACLLKNEGHGAAGVTTGLAR